MAFYRLFFGLSAGYLILIIFFFNSPFKEKREGGHYFWNDFLELPLIELFRRKRKTKTSAAR